MQITPEISFTGSQEPSKNSFHALDATFDDQTRQGLQSTDLWPMDIVPNGFDINGEWFVGTNSLEIPKITASSEFSPNVDAESMMGGFQHIDAATILRGEGPTAAGSDPRPDEVVREGFDDKEDAVADFLFPATATANKFEQSALHIAAVHGHTSLVTLFLNPATGPGRMHVDERDSEDNTPLHCACFNGRAEAALCLLQHGADPNARNTSGWTPVHFAVLKGSPEIVKMLTRFGADLSIRAHGRQYCRSGKVYDPL